MKMETAMNISFVGRFFRARQVYWSVIKELSAYTDRELHDLGIDRADIQQILEGGVEAFVRRERRYNNELNTYRAAMRDLTSS